MVMKGLKSGKSFLFPVFYSCTTDADYMTSLVQLLIKILADGQFHSGTGLGKSLQVSRAAVWKSISKLEDLGLNVHAVRGKGYRLEQPLSLLDRQKIKSALDAQVSARIQEIHALDSIDSTNAYALRQLQEGKSVPVTSHYNVYLAEQQTSGKGRRGRTWVSPYGENIYLTLVKQFETGIGATEGLSLVVGVAVARALADLGIQGLGLKWPNDVLHNRKKLCGILLEMTGDFSGLCQLLIGVGINTCCRDEVMQEVDQPWTDLYKISDKRLDRNDIASATISHIVRALDDLADHGLAIIMDEWKALDVMEGHTVELRSSGDSIKGVARGVSDTGALLLETEVGVQSFMGGEVSLRSIGRNDS